MANSEARTSSDAALASGGEYQVFLSFRGPDTRYGFTDFLYDGLVDAGVCVFKDNDELRIGEVIGENLLSAINNSIIYIPIFSRTYASSKWCLWELAHIVDNVSKSEDEKSILPIFLDVEPDDVKLKTPLYSNALSEHEKKFLDKVEVWRAALTAVGKIKGWNVRSSQAAIVKLVVGEVLEKLKIKQKPVTENLVGLGDRVKDLIDFLDGNHDDVRLIGIYGMGGIGKTTIAKVIFNKLYSHFGKYCSFLEDVREKSTKEGIVQLQRKLLHEIVGSQSVETIGDCEQGMMRIGQILSNKKVLVVLDDVNEKYHITKLIGNSILYPGSRVIITTRDTTILEVDGFKGETLLYEMRKMDDGHALRLFCQHAFGRDFPSDDYHRLSSEIVSTTGGLPLAIAVIGSLLKLKKKAFWEETLDRLREVPEEQVLEKLRISYSDLDKYQQQIFLDIACFFFNEKKTDAIYMWADCRFYPERGIEVLTKRGLIKILDNDMFWMHDQLKALGRQIVREDSLGDLGKQSRLWMSEEALEIIKTQARKHEVQALEIYRNGLTTKITNEDFERLPNLRYLKLHHGTYAGDFAKYRSNLKWFSWHSPRGFKADNLDLDRLVVCKLDNSDFKNKSKAWGMIKNARHLKVLSITLCSGITTIPNISRCSGLERLTLAKCRNLKRIESFIGNLQLLIELKINDCCNFTNLPEEVGALVKLKHFSLAHCRRLRKLPGSLGNLASLTELNLSGTRIREPPNSIGKLKSLHVLRLSNELSSSQKPHVWQFPRVISMLENLEELNLSGCDGIKGEIPVEIKELSHLIILNLSHTSICGIPRTINILHHLQTLNLRDCHEIQELPELPTSLTCLHLQSESLLSVPNLANLTNLVELLLSNYKFLGEKSKPLTGCNLRWIRRLSSLKKLELNLLNVPAPRELVSLSHLERLALTRLDLESLVQLPPSLENLSVKGCELLQRLSIPLELLKLRQVSVLSCPKLIEIQVVGLLKSLEAFCVYECKSLTRISGLSYLKKLENFAILCCNVLTVVEGLHELESLKSLEIGECTWRIYLESSREKILLRTPFKVVVFQLDWHNEKDKMKAMRIVAGCSGVYSISVNMRDPELTVTGVTDPLIIARLLRKRFRTDILSIEMISPFYPRRRQLH